MNKNIDIEDIYKFNTNHLRVTNIYHGLNPDKITLFLIDILEKLNDIDIDIEINNKNKIINDLNIKTDLLNNNLIDIIKKYWINCIQKTRKKYKLSPSTLSLNYIYRDLLSKKKIKRNLLFELLNISKLCRTNSGITQITVLTSPNPMGQEFSCEHDCYYCPNEPSHEGNNFTPQPRSYLYNEPAVRRANFNDFEPHLQMWDRMSCLSLCGLNIDKLEVFILGGTWGSYPEEYRLWFCKMLYYAANTFYISIESRREPYNLETEISINEIGYEIGKNGKIDVVRIIGLTPETRPDHVTSKELLILHKIRATRVQLGVQHTDKRVLSKINRGCYLDDIIRANKNLKDCCFKVDAHLMPLLDGTTLEKDKKMFNEILYNPNLQFEQWKIYPFVVTPWSRISNEGKYIPPYTEDELNELIIDINTKVHPYIRINRISRDIPNTYDELGNHMVNRRQYLQDIMNDRGLRSMCIRSREPKNINEALYSVNNGKIIVRKYDANQGKEYFISFESQDKKYIYGFCRLRLSNNSGFISDIKARIHRKTKFDNEEKKINLFPFLNSSALIRELHVYGNMNPVSKQFNKIQHLGIGKKLIRKAELISYDNNYNKISIISGVGVRNYYKKRDYILQNGYMVKQLNFYNYIINLFIEIIEILSYYYNYYSK